jgi:hypothetical protein
MRYSALVAEIFVQYLEHNYIINILKKHHITDYYRYVDDVLIIYNEDHTNIDNKLTNQIQLHTPQHPVHCRKPEKQ